MKKVGIFAGTFDPIHEGHVAFALACSTDLSLDTVLFLPERQPRRKKGVTNFDVRTAQMKSRLESEPALSVLALPERRLNVEKTLPRLMELYPDAELYLLLGSDVALHLKDWKNIETLLEQINIAIGMRRSHSEEEIHIAMRALAARMHITPRYSVHRTAFSNISSSQLRK